MGFHWGSEARPIAMNNPGREKPRRESIAGSLVGGMSWGGVSVGSWIRDEYVPQFYCRFSVRNVGN